MRAPTANQQSLLVTISTTAVAFYLDHSMFWSNQTVSWAQVRPLIARGWVELADFERHGTPAQRAELTDAGRAALETTR